MGRGKDLAGFTMASQAKINGAPYIVQRRVDNGMGKRSRWENEKYCDTQAEAEAFRDYLVKMYGSNEVHHSVIEFRIKYRPPNGGVL
jgi:hypothetical protein